MIIKICYGSLLPFHNVRKVSVIGFYCCVLLVTDCDLGFGRENVVKVFITKYNPNYKRLEWTFKFESKLLETWWSC